MRLIIVPQSIHLHGLDLTNTHALILIGNRTETLPYGGRFPLIYSPEKPELTLKNVPYTDVRVGFMQLNQRQQNDAIAYASAGFSGEYSDDGETLIRKYHAYMEFDKEKNIVFSSNDVMEILERLKRNRDLYDETFVVLGNRHLLISQIVHEYLDLQSPIYFAKPRLREDHYVLRAFERRHETPWTPESSAACQARYNWNELATRHKFRYNSYQVFTPLLQACADETVRTTEFKALSYRHLQALFYLKNNASLSLVELQQRIDENDDRCNPIGAGFSTDFRVLEFFERGTDAGFFHRLPLPALYELTSLGSLMVKDVLDLDRSERAMYCRIKERTRLGLLHPDGTETALGLAYANALAAFRLQEGFSEVVDLIGLRHDRDKPFAVDVVEKRLFSRRLSDTIPLKLDLSDLLYDGLVQQKEVPGGPDVYELSAFGRRFVEKLHPRTLEPGATGRMHRWFASNDVASINRYINTLFGRQKRYSAMATLP